MTMLHVVRSTGAIVVLAVLRCACAQGGTDVAGPGPDIPQVVDYFVSVSGDDSNPGTDRRSPFRTVRKALQRAAPGQRISIEAGEYFEDVRSVRPGEQDKPIWLTGVPGAVIKGGGKARVIEIRHSHIVLANFAVDGEVRGKDGKTTYRDKLVYVMGRNRRGVTGVRLLNLDLRNAGGECVRMKYFARENEVAHSRVTRCGVRDFERGRGGKNGEGIYIGTAPEQLERNPTADSDASNGNWIHHNRFDMKGNECVDVKEGAFYNVVEHNDCTGQLDEKSGGVSFRGNRNVVRFNTIRGNRGAGIRFGGDSENDGIENDAYGNTLEDNAAGAFKVMRRPQGRVCGNMIAPASGKSVRGKFANAIDPAAPCS